MNDLRKAEIEQKLRDLAYACTVAAVQSSMGRVLPHDEAIRDFVRIGRIIEGEIETPTEAPKSDDAPAEPVESDDLVDLLGAQGTLA